MENGKQVDFPTLYETHGCDLIAERTGYAKTYIYQLYRGERSCSRKAMIRLTASFPEFSGDLDMRRDIARAVNG